MCLWLQKFRNKIVCGIANIDVYTGKSLMFEYDQSYAVTPDAYDELEKYISIYNPSEVIIIHNLAEDAVENIIKFSGITTDCIHKHNLEQPAKKTKSANETRVKNCEKQVYQNEVLTRFFETVDYDEKYLNYPIATQALCFLLDFVYVHNPSLVEKIEAPVFDNKSDRLILANHSLNQLNIISTEGRGSKVSSLQSLLNCCVTSMGKRLFNTVLLNPICSVSKLNTEYAIQEHFSLNYGSEKVSDLRSTLSNIKDIERVLRKLFLKRITPADFYFMVKDLDTLRSLYADFEKDSTLIEYLSTNNINTLAKKVKSHIKKTLDLESAATVASSNDFDANFVRRGFSEHHDILVEAWMDSAAKVEAVRSYLNDFVKRFEKNKSSKTTKKIPDYVKIHSTEKSGFFAHHHKAPERHPQKRFVNTAKKIRFFTTS